MFNRPEINHDFRNSFEIHNNHEFDFLFVPPQTDCIVTMSHSISTSFCLGHTEFFFGVCYGPFYFGAFENKWR